jgi:hypothetical protein
MQRMSLAMGRKAYERLFKAELNASNVEALEALFLAAETGSRWKQRRRKPNFLGYIAAQILVVYLLCNSKT